MLTNCLCNGSSHFQLPPVASEMENPDSTEIIDEGVASSSAHHDEETNGGGEEGKHCSTEIEAADRSAEENVDEEKERLRELGNLIGPENLKALLDAEGGRRRDFDAYQGPSRWRRRRRRRSGQKKILTSDDQIQVQQALELPLDTAKVETKEQGKSGQRICTTYEDNLVMRKLLRRPRYFDPPTDELEKLCSRCGEEGHIARRCPSQNEKKPCFLCGSFDHAWKHCGQNLCEGEGCCNSEEEDNVNSKICLRCRESGHDMLSCKSDYSPDDLKEIECYSCKKVGHLCCSEFPEAGPLEISCYQCGGSGHLGSGCTGESIVRHQKKSRFRRRYRKRTKFLEAT